MKHPYLDQSDDSGWDPFDDGTDNYNEHVRSVEDLTASGWKPVQVNAVLLSPDGNAWLVLREVNGDMRWIQLPLAASESR